jgi:8-oxo-dGTP diphosphatase
MKPPSSKKLHFAVLAVDTVLFTFRDGRLYVRVMPVHLPPHFNHLVGLPGGLIRPDETAEQTAVRLLRDKAHISADHIYLEQLYTFSDVKRDPRGRVVAVAYMGVGSWTRFSKEEQKDTEQVRWVPVEHLPKLAYDHKDIISVGVERLRVQIASTTLISMLMPSEFTLTELEQAYETLLDREVDKRNFRKKIMKLGVLKKSAHQRRGQRSRPAQLYSFSTQKVEPIDVF